MDGRLPTGHVSPGFQKEKPLMDTDTALGIALIISQMGWGIAAWKASKQTRDIVEAHIKEDEAFQRSHMNDYRLFQNQILSVVGGR